MKKDSLLTYFTEDVTWIQPFAIGSLLIYITYAVNMFGEQSRLAQNTTNQSLNTLANMNPDMTIAALLLFLASVVILIILQGFFALNTNSLVNCPEDKVKLAHFKNPWRMFAVGFKYFLAAAIYGAGIGATAGLIFIPLGYSGILKGNAVGLIAAVLWVLAVIYLIWLFVYMSFAYSRELSFRSMFKFSNFGKYKVGKYILCNIIFFIVIIFVSIFFKVVMKDQTTFNYFINLICAPITMWYFLILSKIQADSIKEAISK